MTVIAPGSLRAPPKCLPLTDTFRHGMAGEAVDAPGQAWSRVWLLPEPWPELKPGLADPLPRPHLKLNYPCQRLGRDSDRGCLMDQDLEDGHLGAAIAIVVFAWNLLGDSLRDVLDPRLRGST